MSGINKAGGDPRANPMQYNGSNQNLLEQSDDGNNDFNNNEFESQMEYNSGSAAGQYQPQGTMQANMINRDILAAQM